MIGKTVLVTGAAKRVGRSIACELHAAGANLMVSAAVTSQVGNISLLAGGSMTQAVAGTVTAGGTIDAQAFALEVPETAVPLTIGELEDRGPLGAGR